MSFKIGFKTDDETNGKRLETIPKEPNVEAKKSVVDVYFPDRHITCAYYNDKFDLKVGDLVFVDGKLEGVRGKVVGLNYSFKIKLSDYHRVISVANTDVKGEFFMAGSHFATTDCNALPYEQIIGWFKAPSEDEEFVISNDDEAFNIDDLSGMNIDKATADKGNDYYMENRVVYIEIKDGKARAIVSGTEYYEVVFDFENGDVRNLVCDCYCTGTCKHEFATILQLRETLDIIAKEYGDGYYFDYLAAVTKPLFFNHIINNKTNGSIVVN